MLSEIPSSPVAKLIEAARTEDRDFVAAVRAFIASEDCDTKTVAEAYRALDARSLDDGVLAHGYKLFAQEVRTLKPDLIPSLPLDVPWEWRDFYARERAKRETAKMAGAAAGLQLIVAHLQTPHAAPGAPTPQP